MDKQAKLKEKGKKPPQGKAKTAKGENQNTEFAELC